MERAAHEAWPHFVGWRVNYERAAHALAWAVSEPPALWSGPRRSGAQPLPPLRPPDLETVPGRPAGDPPPGSSGTGSRPPPQRADPGQLRP